jgi:guanine deaminase
MILHGRLLVDPEAAPSLGWLRVEHGRITEIGEGDPPGIVNFGNSASLICPGFIDAHLHLPQFRAIGCDGMDLLDWLNGVIFPVECRWSSVEFAADEMSDALDRLLHAGTLGFAAFLTSHAHSVGCAIEALRSVPLRAMVGQVLMDRAGPHALINQTPQPPRPPAPIPGMPHERVMISVNPRFAVSCSGDLLKLAEQMAGDVFPIQTHLAESQRECDVVRELHPESPHYTAVYDRYGLLGPRTLLAHGVHLSVDEWKVIAERNSVVVHCPGANTFLSSGLFDLRAARESGVRIALGSDVAAGPDIAMPRVARQMIEAAKMRKLTIDPEAHVPNPAEAWRMITRGNAEALGWEDAGLIEVGAAADLLVIEPTFDLEERDEHLIGRLIYNWDDSFITARIVAGRAYA